MKRFMKFIDIMELVSTGVVQPGLIIRSVANNGELILNEFILANSTQRMKAFCDNERNIVQYIEPSSIWELVNVELDGDIKYE